MSVANDNNFVLKNLNFVVDIPKIEEKGMTMPFLRKNADGQFFIEQKDSDHSYEEVAKRGRIAGERIAVFLKSKHRE